MYTSGTCACQLPMYVCQAHVHVLVCVSCLCVCQVPVYASCLQYVSFLCMSGTCVRQLPMYVCQLPLYVRCLCMSVAWYVRCLACRVPTNVSYLRHVCNITMQTRSQLIRQKQVQASIGNCSSLYFVFSIQQRTCYRLATGMQTNWNFSKLHVLSLLFFKGLFSIAIRTALYIEHELALQVNMHIHRLT